MRWTARLPLILLTACLDRGASDKVTLCERSPFCSAHPLPDGQNGIEWTTQGGARNAGAPAATVKH